MSSNSTTKAPVTFLDHVETWGGDILSVIFFILWFVQISRSTYYYWILFRQDNNRSTLFTKSLISITHLMLFVANFLYLGYELRGAKSNFIPLLITMYFFLNFASIISFKVITMDNSTDHCFLSIPARKLIHFLMML